MDSAADEQLNKLNELIKDIELNLKKCSKKYKGREEIEELYINLTVSFSFLYLIIYISQNLF